MAKAAIQRRVRLLEAPATQVVPISHWQAPKGVNYTAAKNRVNAEQATTALNVRLNHGYFKSRPGMTGFGVATGGGGTQLQVVNFVKSTGESFVIRFDTNFLYKWDGAAWNAITGAGPFTGAVTDYWTFTTWNDTLIVSNGVDGTYTVNASAGTMAIIAAAPPAKHLSTWAGRIVATDTLEGGNRFNRLRWSVKNSSTDWAGIGSGYEDFLSTPGGQGDIIIGSFPVTEEVAFIVRGNSIWQATQTGDPDAPFRFTRAYSELGAKGPHSVQSTPEGIVFYGTDNIYHITLSGIEAIGEPIRPRLANVQTPATSWGLYNPLNREYHLGVGEGSPTVLDMDWVYSFADRGWTQYTFPFNFRSFGYTRFTVSGSIDMLTGTIDALFGVIDTLGALENGEGMFVVGETAGKYIGLLDIEKTTDVDPDNITVDSPITIATGTLAVDDSRHRTKVIECELEYEATVSQTLSMKLSLDGGTTWSTFGGSKAIAETTGPQIIRWQSVVSGNQVMAQVYSAALGGLTVIAFHVHTVKDSRIHA